MISGIVAQILARNPGLTPDQVKGAVMRRARACRCAESQLVRRRPGQRRPGGVQRDDVVEPEPVPLAEANSCGVGQVNAVRAVYNYNWTSNPNAGLNKFLSTDAHRREGLQRGQLDGRPGADVSWDAVSWTDVSWSDVSWDAVSWSDVSWTDVSWTDVSWSDVSWEDAGNDAGTPDGSGVPLTPEQELAAAADPDLTLP